MKNRVDFTRSKLTHHHEDRREQRACSLTLPLRRGRLAKNAGCRACISGAQQAAPSRVSSSHPCEGCPLRACLWLGDEQRRWLLLRRLVPINIQSSGACKFRQPAPCLPWPERRVCSSSAMQRLAASCQNCVATSVQI